MEYTLTKDKKYLNFIKVVSVVIPIAVAVLIYLPGRLTIGEWAKNLPLVNAILNSTTTVLLIAALVSIKKKQINIHKILMSVALVLGSIFLLSYVLYHASFPSVVFGDLDHNGQLSAIELQQVGSLRAVYLVVLLSHIGLSIVVVPFVLFSFYYSLSGQIDRHKKVVKFSYPIWLYVSITGVLVYYLIHPYYV